VIHVFRGWMVSVACAALALVPCPAMADTSISTGRPSLTEAIAAGAQVIDVRTPDEFASGHIEGAKNIEYDEILKRLSELNADRSKPIVLYCASGFRAGKALKALEGQGYSAVFNAGGYDELKELLIRGKE
jgi:phage shock protein E